MLGFLLITWKNGRQPQPYGVNRLEVYNMKFTFICIVTVISCSVCAYGDLDSYTGKYDSDRQRRHFMEFPWMSDNDYDYPRIKFQDYDLDRDKLDEILAKNEKQLINEAERHFANYARNRLREPYQYKKLANNYGQYRRQPSNQVLDDVRMYPQLDDFMFKDDEEEEDPQEVNSKNKIFNEDLLNEKIVEDNTRRYLKQMEKALDQADEIISHDHHMVEEIEDPVTEELGKSTFKNVKFAEDPSEFAYVPSDPRFYQTDEIPVDNSDKKVSNEVLNDENVGKIKIAPSGVDFKVKPRSDHKTKTLVTDNSQLMNHDQFGELGHGHQPDVVIQTAEDSPRVYIIAIVAGISAAATVGLIAVGIGWYNIHKHVKDASDVEYPAYGVTGPNKDVSPSGDRRLAQSAQMYHYQHQKQQILAMENRATAADRHGSVSEVDSDEENEEGDYTVYECPGLAPTGEMEVKNPMFQDDPTPAQTPQVKPNHTDEKK